MNTCLNCALKYEGAYCPACSQKATVKRMTWKDFMQDLPKVLFNLDKGLWYTMKRLTIAPKAMLQEYLAGRRVRYLGPMQYAVLGVTIYFLLREIMKTPITISAEALEKGANYDLGYAIGKIIRGNLKYFWLLNVLFFALPARLFFGKYNYTEHLVISAYIIGHTAFLSTFTLFISSLPILINPLVYLLIVVYYFILFKEQKNQLGTFSMAFALVTLGLLLFAMLPVVLYFVKQLLGI